MFSGDDDDKEAGKVQEEGDVALEDLAKAIEQDVEEKKVGLTSGVPLSYLEVPRNWFGASYLGVTS